MWRLIHEAHLARSCDSLRHQLEKEIVIGANALIKADSLIAIKQRQVNLEREGGKILKFQIQNKEDELKDTRAEVRKQATLKWIGFGGTLGGVVAGPAGAVVGGGLGWVFGKLIPAKEI